MITKTKTNVTMETTVATKLNKYLSDISSTKSINALIFYNT